MRAVALTQVVTEVGFDTKKALETITAVEKQLLNIALFLTAPFIGLLYAMALPFVGIGMFVYVGIKALTKTAAYPVMKKVALFIAAPFIGLAYAVAFPFVGIAMIIYTGIQAYLKQA